MSEPVFEPQPTPAAEPEPVAEAAEAPWSVDRGEWEQVRNFIGAAGPVLGQMAQMLQARQEGFQPQAPQQPQQPQAPEFDPWEPESVRNYIQSEISTGVRDALDQGLGPYGPLLESVASVEGEKQARAVLSSLGEEVGAFDEDASMILAAGLLSQGNVPPEHALRVSANYMSELEKRIREDERTRYMDELKNLSTAPQEHPVGPSAGEVETVPTGPQRYHEAVQRALARRNAGLPIG